MLLKNQTWGQLEFYIKLNLADSPATTLRGAPTPLLSVHTSSRYRGQIGIRLVMSLFIFNKSEIKRGIYYHALILFELVHLRRYDQ